MSAGLPIACSEIRVFEEVSLHWSLHLWPMYAKSARRHTTQQRLSGTGLCATPEEGNGAPQTMATYYNPAYRPALEEELSSTDVKHAALSFRC